jgi:hypothetical protein
VSDQPTTPPSGPSGASRPDDGPDPYRVEALQAAAPSDVLEEIRAERARQDARWGVQNHPDGTGDSYWRQHADSQRTMVQHEASAGRSNWTNILREEIYEAFAEDDPAKLRTELVQVAAVAAAWIEAIDRRAGGQ